MVQTSNLLFPGPGKSKMVQTSKLLFPGPGKSKMVQSKMVQTSNLLFPSPGKSKMVQTSILLFPRPGKTKMVQTSNLLFPGPGKRKMKFLPIWKAICGARLPSPAWKQAAPVRRPSAYEPGALSIRPQLSEKIAFFLSLSKRKLDVQFAFPAQTSNLLFPGPGKSKV